jgi:hypothetical protein
MKEGAGLPVPDRRDNYRIVREVHVVAVVMMVHGWHPVEEYSCSRPRIPNGQQPHSLVKTSFQPVFLILWIVPGHQEYLLHLPLGTSAEIPGLRLLQYVRYYRDRIGRNRLLTELMKEKIRFWHSPARIANLFRSKTDDPGPYQRLSPQIQSEQTTAKRHNYRRRFPMLFRKNQMKNQRMILKTD